MQAIPSPSLYLHEGLMAIDKEPAPVQRASLSHQRLLVGHTSMPLVCDTADTQT